MDIVSTLDSSPAFPPNDTAVASDAASAAFSGFAAAADLEDAAAVSDAVAAVLEGSDGAAMLPKLKTRLVHGISTLHGL